VIHPPITSPNELPIEGAFIPGATYQFFDDFGRPFADIRVINQTPENARQQAFYQYRRIFGSLPPRVGSCLRRIG